MVKSKDVIIGKPYLWIQKGKGWTTSSYRTEYTKIAIMKVMRVSQISGRPHWFGEMMLPILNGSRLSRNGKFGELYDLNKLWRYKNVEGYKYQRFVLARTIVSGIFTPREM